MKRKTEYVMYFGDEVTHECMGQDVDGDRNKRQADKEIKEEMSGVNDDGQRLLAVRKYLWKGDDGDWDLWDDELYWYHPQLNNEEGDGYQ
tara:strand:- start:510 stop:779 length:270 start_codon:yes stop_codon:yes gene_type:complete